jgi:hypothetical protein
MPITGVFLWLRDPAEKPIPAPIGDCRPTREQVRAAAQWAIRAATERGAVSDFDPDAMVQNFEYALLGSATVVRKFDL